MDEERRKALVDQFSKEHESFVIITCNPPGPDGNMDVNMCYGGDLALVSYLIKGAHQVLDEASEPDLEEEAASLRLIK